MTHESALRKNLTAMGYHADAVDWLMMVWDLIQVFDDAADGDTPPRDQVSRAVWAAFVGMPTNAFYTAKAPVLTPILATQILKWEASDRLERAGAGDAMTFAWRAGFYDLVLWVGHLCGLSGHGEAILALYGESFEDYRKEFDHA